MVYGDHGRVKNPRITVRLCLDMPRNPTTEHFGLDAILRYKGIRHATVLHHSLVNSEGA